jgi:outer membrane protein assembly factor BamB
MARLSFPSVAQRICLLLLVPALLIISDWQSKLWGDEPKPATLKSLWTRTKGHDWAQFLGPHRNGKSTEKGFSPDWKAKPPKLLYSIDVGEGYGACSVSRGRMLHFDRVKNENRLRCFNAESGELFWTKTYLTDYKDHYGYDGGPRCSPLIDDDRVYTMDAQGVITCFKVDDGDEVWSVDTGKKYQVVQNFFGAGSNPIIYKNWLIAMVGGSPKEDQDLLPSELLNARGNKSGIVAFDKHVGRPVYSVTDELASYSSLQLTEIDQRPWCLAFVRSGLIGIDPRSGKQDFHFPWRAKILESVNASMPIVVGDEVLISETYGPGAALLRLSAGKEPKVVWKDKARSREKSLQTHWNTPIVHDGHIYACSGRHTNDADLRCVDWNSGEVKWSKAKLNVPGTKEPVPLTRTSLTYLDGHLLCQGEYGDLMVLKATPSDFSPVAILPPSIDQRGRPRLTYPCWAAPVVSHGLMWLRGEQQLLCYEIIPEE